ncbi:MAG: DUF1553 domain-containing protein [Planctomycetes bacterium]|nr:DUF1553 domain-containing protein [Planctomycetota bacterium]
MSRHLVAILVLASLSSATHGGEPRPVDFRTDVIAALSRAGCNQGTCHGSPNGKNGFRLSLRGFDPDVDLHTLTRGELGRRVDRQRPENSLFLLKATGSVPHQGGVRVRAGEPAYEILKRWVAEGCKDGGPATLEKLEVTPESAQLPSGTRSRQITVRARFKSGEIRDVTDLTVFSVNTAGAATVSHTGLVEFKRTGEASILVRYLDQIRSARLQYVEHDPTFAFRSPPIANDIDKFVFAKQKELQLNPLPLATDEVFLRRVYLDTIGVLPSAAEARVFLDSKDPRKRAKLIDELLERDEYAAFWALKWADVLRGSPTTISERGVHSFHRYLVKTIADDKPMDQFARELLTGLGNTLHKPAANFYRVSRTPDETAEAFAQLFLGVSVQCAKCHNHPFESITQTDYYGLAAYFAQVQFKGAKFGLDDEIVYLQPGREVQHPTTRKKQDPMAFGYSAGKLAPEDDRREKLAEWLTRSDNRYFAPSLVNRVWYHLLGRGIVEPVDDFRDTNPPSNPELLDYLAKDFAKSGYRLKPLMRGILNSNTYQLASVAPVANANAPPVANANAPPAANANAPPVANAPGSPKQSPFAADPDRYFTKASIRMLAAEQILDAISSATGIAEPFKGYPLGTRAMELAEGGVNHPFLQAFSKPVRDVSCECAREDDPSLPQMLHLLNNKGMLNKVHSPNSRLAKALGQKKDDRAVIEEIYLATLSRRPAPGEVAIAVKHIASVGDRARGLQDVQYALFNLGEFLLRH